MLKVIVSDYAYEWPNKYEIEAFKIREVFGEELVEIHHIGSTSVPGLKAKTHYRHHAVSQGYITVGVDCFEHS